MNKLNLHKSIISRLELIGSPYQLSILRILFSIQIFYNSYSRIFELFKKGIGTNHTFTIFQIFDIQTVINNILLDPLQVIVLISSLFFAIGLFTRVIAPILSLSYLILYSVHYSYFDAPLPWLYIWFPLFILSFSNCSDVLSIDSFQRSAKNKSEKASNLYRWPVELIRSWFVYIYFSAGIAKIFPLVNGFYWMNGGISQKIVYERYLDSILHQIFSRPFFDYSEENILFAFLSIGAVIIELSTIIVLFTSRYNLLILFLILSMHSFLFLIGVPGFGILSLILGVSLFPPKWFNGFFKKN